MSALASAYEKLSEGIHVLVTHRGRVKERLIEALPYFAAINPDDLPEDAKREWLRVWATATRLESSKESGSFAPSINALTEDDAVRLAEQIDAVEAIVRGELFRMNV